jgi:hypothetical protein
MWREYLEIIHEIMSILVPHNIVMDMNNYENVMLCDDPIMMIQEESLV